MLEKIRSVLLRDVLKAERRRIPAAGPKPALGGYIARNDVAIKITGPLSTDIWRWFILLGWREVNVKTNRRKFYRLPNDTLEKIVNANVFERDVVYQELIKKFE